MDNPSLEDLENELKALRPRRPSILLRARVEHELTRPAPPSVSRYSSATTLRSWKWMSWQSVAAAVVAVVAGLVLWNGSTRETVHPLSPLARSEASSIGSAPTPNGLAKPQGVASRDSYRPVKASNVLYDLKDEGTVLLEDNTPARRIRARYVDTYTWKNPATNASLKWSVPRDEVRMLPASFN